MGTLGKALGSYGAYVCASREIVDYLVNTARSFVFSTAPRPRCSPRRWRRWSCSRPTRTGSSACRPTRAAARGAGRRGARGRRVGDPDRPGRGRRRGAHDGAVRADPRARRLRPGDPPPTVPEGSSRLRFTVMATHRAGELQRAAKLVGAAAREMGIAARPQRTRWRSSPDRVARRLRHRHRHRGRQDGRRRGDRARPRRRRQARRRLQARGHRPRRAGRARPRAAAPRRRLGAERRGDRPLPLRAAGLAAPGGGAGRRGDRPAAAARGRSRRRTAPTRSSARASAACSSRSLPATRCETSPSTWRCRW